MNVTPIQTRYAGCLFRSRLEARWAVFFDRMNIAWQYEPEGYDLGEAGWYLPDFLLYPNTPLAAWFEVKGTFPGPEELRKAQALSQGTGLRVYVYFAELGLPAPATLADMSAEEFMDHEEERFWDDRLGWLPPYPKGPAKWEIGLAPTAYMFSPNARPGQDRPPHSNFWWWTDCPYCGQVILKLYGQVGWCPRFGDNDQPPEPLYPRFAHATKRLQAAYTAARSARFEHGAHGN